MWPSLPAMLRVVDAAGRAVAGLIAGEVADGLLDAGVGHEHGGEFINGVAELRQLEVRFLPGCFPEECKRPRHLSLQAMTSVCAVAWMDAGLGDRRMRKL